MSTNDDDVADLDAARAAAREARERAEKATPGPWSRDDNRGHHFTAPDPHWPDIPGATVRVISASTYPGQEGMVFASPDDAAFVLAARTGWPECAAHVDTLADEVDRLRAALTSIAHGSTLGLGPEALGDLARAALGGEVGPLDGIVAEVSIRESEAYGKIRRKLDNIAGHPLPDEIRGVHRAVEEWARTTPTHALSRSQMIERGMHDEVTAMDRAAEKGGL